MVGAGEAHEVGDDHDRDGGSKLGDDLETIVDRFQEGVGDPANVFPVGLGPLPCERAIDGAANPSVFGRLEVDEGPSDQAIPVRQVGRVGAVIDGIGWQHVTNVAPERPVAQDACDVGVAAEEGEAPRRVEQRRLLAQSRIGRVWVADECGVVCVEHRAYPLTGSIMMQASMMAMNSWSPTMRTMRGLDASGRLASSASVNGSASGMAAPVRWGRQR